MKKIISFLFLALILVSCGKEDKSSDNRDCREVDYDMKFDLQLTDEVCFPDGNSLTVVGIEHGFCPCQAPCGGQGDLYIVTSISSSNGIEEKNYYVGRLDDDPSIFDDHEITSLSYIYGTEDEEVPHCVEDFDPEKVTFTLSISPI